MNDTAFIALPTEYRRLPTAVADRLREMIIESKLPPGERLNERHLCEWMDVSRTPLREALRLLAHDGLVAVIPNRGAFVAQMSPEAVRQTFEIIGALEALAAGLARRSITDAEVGETAALTFEMQAGHDLPEYYLLNRVVHDAILAASRNAVLDEMAHRLNLRIQNLRFRSNLDVGKWNAAVKEHQQMVELLRARDGAGLARLMRTHLARKAEAVLAMLP